MKNVISIFVMLTGILLFILGMILKLDDVPGILMVFLSVIMTIGGFASLCIINRNRKKNLGWGFPDLLGCIFEFIFEFILG